MPCATPPFSNTLKKERKKENYTKSMSYFLEEWSRTKHLNFISALSGRCYHVQLTKEETGHNRPGYVFCLLAHRWKVSGSNSA